MAISPNIPTSFVPRQIVDTNRRKFNSGTDLLLIGSLVVLGIAIAAAAATYGYQLYLTKLSTAKAQELQKAQSLIDQSTVEGFVRLSTRIANAKTILDSHIVASRFFDLLENITLQSVHFNSLSFTLNKDKSANLEMNGVAKNFNALAAQSAAFANDKRIKHAIFSGFSVNKDNSVSFQLAAEVDSKLILSAASAALPAGLTGTTSSATPLAPSTPAPVTSAGAPSATTSPFAPASVPAAPPTGTSTTSL